MSKAKGYLEGAMFDAGNAEFPVNAKRGIIRALIACAEQLTRIADALEHPPRIVTPGTSKAVFDELDPDAPTRSPLTREGVDRLREIIGETGQVPPNFEEILTGFMYPMPEPMTSADKGDCINWQDDYDDHPGGI